LFVIFTEDLALRPMDWPDWCMLTQAKERKLAKSENSGFWEARFPEVSR
jgi:hypothetical protein